MYKRKTKLVVTVGPAIEMPEKLSQLIDIGVDVFRLNFSHGTQASHHSCLNHLRAYADAVNKPIGIIGDLQGPKVRVGQFLSGRIELKSGDFFTLYCSASPKMGDQSGVWVDYAELVRQVQPQETLLIDDGAIRLLVQRVEGENILCQTLVGGSLSDRKGVNKLGGGISAPLLTQKDKEDMALAVAMGVDYLAVSFVKSAADLEAAREIAKGMGFQGKLIAKVERAEAVLDEKSMVDLVDASDAIMVARGDLAIEIGDESLPFIQKQLIAIAKRQGKPVITATQMLESMIRQPFPTRAEVLDVANAVLDGTDAIMLSAESATGAYPVEAAIKAINICQGIENPSNYHSEQFSTGLKLPEFSLSMKGDLATALVNGVAAMVKSSTAVKLCVVFTASGKTAALLSSLLANIPIVVLTLSPETCSRCKLLRSVDPIVVTAEMANNLSAIMEILKQKSYIQPQEVILFVRGDRLFIEGGSNACQLIRVPAAGS